MQVKHERQPFRLYLYIHLNVYDVYAQPDFGRVPEAAQNN